MSDIKNDGGSAFPRAGTPKEYSGYVQHSEGMSLRDYFAAKAMQAEITEYSGIPTQSEYLFEIAVNAYLMADAMLKVRGM